MANKKIYRIPINKKNFMKIIHELGWTLKKLGADPIVNRTERTISRQINSGEISPELLSNIASAMMVQKDLLIKTAKETTQTGKRLYSRFDDRYDLPRKQEPGEGQKMDYAYLAIQEREEEKKKKINELLERLKNVTEKEYYPGSKHPYGDRENWHCEADDILCELLDYLGYHDFVEAFEEVPKWYA